MKALDELIIRDAEIKAAWAERQAAERKYIDPIRAKERKAGERANELWLPVLKEYGPGAAQAALREAQAAAEAQAAQAVASDAEYEDGTAFGDW
jgi:hypothetical protein